MRAAAPPVTPLLFYTLPSSYPGLPGRPYVKGLAVDSAGRVLIGEDFAATSCSFGHCGNRVESVGPDGLPIWNAPKSPINGWPAFSSDPFAPDSVFTGIGGRVYFGGTDGGLWGLDVDGEPLGSWPHNVTTPEGTALGFANAPPVLIDANGNVYVKGGISVSFNGFPSAINGFAADGATQWPSLGFADGGRNFGLTFGPQGYVYTIVNTGQLVGVDPATGALLPCQPVVSSYGVSGDTGGLYTFFANTITSRDLFGCGSSVLYVSPYSRVNVQGIAADTIISFEDNYPMTGASVSGVSRNGILKWRREDVTGDLSGVRPLAANGHLYFVGIDAADGVRKMFALNGDTGETEWTVGAEVACLTCAIAAAPDGSLYFTGADDTSVFRMSPVTIGSPPTIVTQPKDQTIIAGQSATLTVVADGTAPLSYQWYQGVSGVTSDPVFGATSAQVTVSPLVATSYWVQITNANGSTNSDTVRVNISTAPSVPEIYYVSPAVGVAGTTIASFVVQGSGFTALSKLSFSGTGLTVLSYQTRTATTVIAAVSISSDAPIGARDVSVTDSLNGVATLRQGFLVRRHTTPARALQFYVDNTDAVGLAEAVASGEKASASSTSARVDVHNFLRMWIGVQVSVPANASLKPDANTGLSGKLAQLRLLPPCPSPTIAGCHSEETIPGTWTAAFAAPGAISITVAMTPEAFGVNLVDTLIGQLVDGCAGCPEVQTLADVVDTFERLDAEVPLFHDALDCVDGESVGTQTACVIEKLGRLALNLKQLRHAYRIVIASVYDLDPRHITLEDIANAFGNIGTTLEMLGDEVTLATQTAGTGHFGTLPIRVGAE